MTDPNPAAQRTALLVVFGMMFTTVGLSIGTADSYGILSWIFLGLGVLLPFVGLVLADWEDGVSSEEEQCA
jgi:hypothetical protein